MATCCRRSAVRRRIVRRAPRAQWALVRVLVLLCSDCRLQNAQRWRVGPFSSASARRREADADAEREKRETLLLLGGAYLDVRIRVCASQ